MTPHLIPDLPLPNQTEPLADAERLELERDVDEWVSRIYDGHYEDEDQDR